MRLSQNSIASHRNCSEAIPNCVSAKIQLHLIDIFLRQFQMVSEPKSIASHRNYSMTVQKFVLADFQLHLVEIILWQFQIVSRPEFHCISSKRFQDNSELCLSQNSIAPQWNYSKTIQKFVLAEIQLHLVEIILWQFQIVS